MNSESETMRCGSNVFFAPLIVLKILGCGAFGRKDFNEPNPFSDRIHIEQLEISAHVGVPEKEGSTPQRLNRNSDKSTNSG
jgi:hypothetical protein